MNDKLIDNTPPDTQGFLDAGNADGTLSVAYEDGYQQGVKDERAKAKTRTSREAEQTKYPLHIPASDEVEEEYNNFWKEIVEKDGFLDTEQVKKELYDFSRLLRNASVVYCEVTGGRMSYTTYDARDVISEYNDHVEYLINEATDASREAKLLEALKPFSYLIGHLDDDMDDDIEIKVKVECGDIRNAKRAVTLAEAEGG